MPGVEVSQLYNRSRFSENVNQFLYLLLYIPVGLTLAILRTLVVLAVYLLSYILPDTQIIHSALHKLICVAFGIVIHVENLDKKEDVEAFFSNQISIFDSLVIHFVTRSVTPSVKLNPTLSTVLGMQHYGSANDIEEFKRNIAAAISENKIPLFFQPESVITNGKALLKFNTWPFTLSSKVQPLAIKVYRPGLDVKVSVYDASYWSELFFFMFCPCTVYKLRFLPVIEKKGLSEIEFVEKTRQSIAGALQVEVTNFSASDLKDYEKRYQIEQQRSRSGQSFAATSVNPELHRMTLQVREVLPLVPYNVVYKDLGKTRSVDLTITNILEGLVQYTPEQPKPSSSTSSSPSATTSRHSSSSTSSAQCSNTRSTLNSAANTFGKSPNERTQSFQERKKQLIENARKRYIEKHGLNIVGS